MMEEFNLIHALFLVGLISIVPVFCGLVVILILGLCGLIPDDRLETTKPSTPRPNIKVKGWGENNEKKDR